MKLHLRLVPYLSPSIRWTICGRTAKSLLELTYNHSAVTCKQCLKEMSKAGMITKEK